MGSRTSDGSRILKTENLESIRHTGEKLPVGRSSDDTVVRRLDNISFRPPRGDATRGT